MAAVASLKESGFAVDRAISRLREMQTAKALVAFRFQVNFAAGVSEHS